MSDHKEDNRAILFSKVIIAFMGTFILIALLVLFLIFAPGRWFMGFSATAQATAKVGEPLQFELCRSGPAIPREVVASRTTDPIDSAGGIQYNFEPTIESEGCEMFNLFASRIPQEPGRYKTTTNIFFNYLGVPKNTTYEFEFEYVE